MARFSAPLVALLVLSALLIAAPLASALSCGQVIGYLSPCIPYARGSGPITPGCCSGVRGLNSVARSTPDRQSACNCIKTIIRSYPGIKPNLVAVIPGKCAVNTPYPISTSTDCSNDFRPGSYATPRCSRYGSEYTSACTAVDFQFCSAAAVADVAYDLHTGCSHNCFIRNQ